MFEREKSKTKLNNSDENSTANAANETVESNTYYVDNRAEEILKSLEKIKSLIEEKLGKPSEPVDLSGIASQESVHELWDNNQGLNPIFKIVSDIRDSLNKAGESGISQDQLDKIVKEITKINSQMSTKIEKSEDTVRSTVSNVISKLNEIKSSIISEIKNINHSNSIQFKSEHRTYITWTTIFAMAMFFSSIFIVRGYLVDFSNQALLTGTFVVFCVTFVTICIFNLVFSIADIDIYVSDSARISYYIVCGCLIALTFSMSMAVLLI